MHWRKILFVLLLAAVAVLVVGCGAVPPSGGSVDDGGIEQNPLGNDAEDEEEALHAEIVEVSLVPVIPETTIVVDDPQNVIQAVEIVDDETVVLIGNAIIGGRQVESGDVLALGPTPDAPYGMLRRVVSATVNADGSVAYSTEQATLTEAIDTGAVSAQIDSAQFIQTDVIGANEPDYARVRHVPLQNGIEIELDPPLKLAETPGGSGIEVGGEVLIEPSFDFDMLIQNKQLETFRLVNTTEVTGDLELKTTLFQVGFNQSVEVQKITFEPIPIPIGAVFTIWVTPVLTINVGVNGNISADLTTSVSQTVIVNAGVYYDGAPHPVWETDVLNVQPQPLTYNQSASAKAYVGPKLELLVFGVAGPYVNAEAYLKLDVLPDNATLYRITGGLSGNAGASVRIFSRVLADWHVTLIDIPWEITEELRPGHDTGSGTTPVTPTTPAPTDTQPPPTDTQLPPTEEQPVVTGGGELVLFYNPYGFYAWNTASTRLDISPIRFEAINNSG